MDFEQSDDQRAIVEAARHLLSQQAGPARAAALAARGEYDHELDAALASAGFAEAALGPETGFLEATLLVEAVARAAGVVAFGAGALVAPGVAGRALPGPVALARLAEPASPVRFGAHARTLLVDAGDEARIVCVDAGSAEAVRTNFLWPLGRVSVRGDDGTSLGAGSGAWLRRWWRLALATEALGAMEAALEITVAYVKGRRQFGRAIGSFQAVQHRLALATVHVEGLRWLCYEAAAKDASEEAAALAAAHACEAAHLVFRETHQLSGAMGYTREHPLHVFSMRLAALQLELGGTSAHRREVARARWAAPAAP
jgi:alkylation response protein AidB-like acyl-CoA dehydrogenase